MAGKQSIDELVSQQAFAQEEKLLAGLKALNDEFAVSIRNAKTFSDTLAGAKSLKQINTDSAKAAIALEKLNQNIQRTAALTAAASAAQDRAAISATRKAQSDERAAQQAEKAAQKAERLKSEYEQLNTEHIRLVKVARDLGAAFGTNSKYFVDAAKAANIYDAKLKDIDKQLGKSSRFVGEYERGNRGLSNSINQLTRELPAFTFSAQTGFLALSNNIPIFFDEIKRSREEIVRLREAGEKVPSLFQQLIGSFLSWGTALSIGVTLLTVYGKEIGSFVTALFKGKEAMDVFAERQKSINEVYKNSNKDISTQITSLKYLYQAATDVNNSQEKRIEAAKELQREFPKTFGLQSQENIINGQASGIYQQLTKDIIANARAKAAAAKISEEVAKQLDAQVQIQKIQAANENENLRTRKDLEKRIRGAVEFDNKNYGRKLTAAQLELNVQKELENQYKTSNDRAKESIGIQNQIIQRAQINIDAVEKLAGGGTAIGNGIVPTGGGDDKKGESQLSQELKLQKAKEQIISDGYKAISENEKRSLDERLIALDNYNKSALKIIDLGRRINLEQEDITNTEIATVNTEAKGEALDQERGYQKERQELIDANNKSQYEKLKELFGTISKAQKEQQDKYISDLSNSSEEELNRIADTAYNSLVINEIAYRKGEISKADYEKNKLNIEHEAAVATIQEQLRLAGVLLDIEEKSGTDVTAQRKKIAELQRKLIKENADFEINSTEDVANKKKKNIESVLDLLQQSAQLAGEVSKISFEQETARIQERKDEVTEETAREIEAVNRSVASESEKADKIAIIQARAKAKQDLLDVRKREIATKQARFDKAIALSNTVQNTYAGAARALKDYPYPFSAIIAGLVIATGLASAANIIASPIPKYAKGTEYHKGGPMIVGDAGTELVIEPGGRQYLTPNSDTLTTAPAGTKVIPNKDVVRMLASPEKINYVGGQSVDINKLVLAQNRTTKAIKSQKMFGTMVTKKGWARQQKQVNDWSNHKRNYLN